MKLNIYCLREDEQNLVENLIVAVDYETGPQSLVENYWAEREDSKHYSEMLENWDESYSCWDCFGSTQNSDDFSNQGCTLEKTGHFWFY